MYIANYAAMRRIIFTIICTLLCTFSGSLKAQQPDDTTAAGRFNAIATLISPEKVYLHTDRDIYNASDTIWVSGYVENATWNSEFPESNYIYVELISSQLNINVSSWRYRPFYEPSLVKRIKLKRHNGGFQGHIVIPDKQSTGKCIVRAYTYWMLNRPVEYMFYKEIAITNPFNDDLLAKMKDKGITDKNKYTQLNAIAPIDRQDQKDSSIVDYDIQFLPESGHSLQGFRNTIWIKALDNLGNEALLWGEVRDVDGRQIGKFQTDSSGTAKLTVFNAAAEELYAYITDSMEFSRTFLLPQAKAQGASITGNMIVQGTTEYTPNCRMMFRVNATPAALQQGLYAVLHNGSQILMSKEITSAESSFFVRLAQLQPGTHSISIVDKANNVYAERPFIVLPSGERNRIGITTDKDNYGAWEKVLCRIKVPGYAKDSLAAENPHVSVAVTDNRLVQDLDKVNIESYFLLKSEVEGYIANPSQYFNREIPLKQRMAKADMLMQTQGWRYYETPDILKGTVAQPNFGREYTQTLSGEVKGLLTHAKTTVVSFVAPSINFTAMGQVDSGYFVLKDISFPENTDFIVSAVGKKGRAGVLTPHLFPDNFAQIHQYPLSPENVRYSKQYKDLVVENLYGDGYAMSLELDPVVVTSSYITMKNSPSPNRNIAIRRDRIRDEDAIKPYASSYDIPSYVISQYPSLRWNPEGAGLLGRRVGASGSMQSGPRWFPILYYLNGTQSNFEEIQNLSLDQVENLVYLEGLEASAHTGSGEISPTPVLMVRTKPHVKHAMPTNVTTGSPIGWQRPKRFYSPNYEKTAKDTDYRITLYWNPNLQLSDNGEAVFTFWTKHKKGSYRVEIEGKTGHREYIWGEHIINPPAEEE